MNTIEEHSFGIIPLKKEGNAYKVLLILHKIGKHWGFPKGKGNPGETPLESATRELKEETGLEIDHLVQQEPLIEKYQFKKKGLVICKTVFYFPAVVTGELKIQEEEIREARWIGMIDALQVLSFEKAREICHQVIMLLS